MKKLRMILLAVVAILFSATAVVAQEKPEGLTLPSVVGSNMVLQHSTTVNLWGWAKPKSKVTITCDWTKAIKAKADADGFWIVQVNTLEAGYTPHTITIKAGKEVKELTNILFGEVWLCSGQSNMEWQVRKDPEMKGDLEAGMNLNIRLYDTGRAATAEPQNDVPKQKKFTPHWSVCNKRDLARFSAVGYGFGKELQEALNVPIGLINASYGGTPIEGWLSAEYLANNTKVAAVANKSRHKRWKSKISHLHNANIYPIRHTTIAGVIWYQGCSNVSYGGYYTMLQHLVKSWREEFRNEDLPFYIVQIAPHTYSGIRGAIVREAQSRVAARNTNCEYVVAIDQNQRPGDIHPPKKGDVAHRLAMCALGGHYGKEGIVFRSPSYKGMTVDGNTVRLYFDNVPTSLVQVGDGRINGFQLGVKDPGNEKKLIFSLAEATIEGKSIVLSAEGVTNPVAVRYCFNEDVGNVYSAEGLPLAPFRSDKSRSLSARPYVEKPSEIAIKFEGSGFRKTSLAEGSKVWPNVDVVVSDEMPKEFAGFELLACNRVERSEMSASGTITAQADGKIYILTVNHGSVRKAGWRYIIPAWVRMKKNDTGKKWGTFYIAERDVVAGEVVELPRMTKYAYGALPLAKSIEY